MYTDPTRLNPSPSTSCLTALLASPVAFLQHNLPCCFAMAPAYSELSALPELPETEFQKDYRYFYGPLIIGVSKRFSHDLKTLLSNQQRAIDLGALYPVTKWRRDYLLGWPFNTTKLACVHVNIPPTTRDTLEYDYISYTESEGNVVSGFFIVPNDKCHGLAGSRHFFSFNDLDKISFKK
jgi:hypothetical protein